MAHSLNKGGSFTLAKAGEILNQVQVGLGWDENSSGGAEYDLDASALALRNSRLFGDPYFVFYNNLQAPNNTIIHTGDDRSGGNSDGGDDETIKINLKELHPEIDQIIIAVSIHDAEQRRQNFGQVRNAYIRIVDDETEREIVRFDLHDEYSMETAVVFGELKKERSEWRFIATGTAYAGGLYEICKKYGVDVK